MIKNKRHWNSFTSAFFIPLENVIECLEKREKLSFNSHASDIEYTVNSDYSLSQASLSQLQQQQSSQPSLSLSSQSQPSSGQATQEGFQDPTYAFGSPLEKLMDSRYFADMIPYYTKILNETPLRCHICTSTQFKTMKSLLEHVTSHR